MTEPMDLSRRKGLAEASEKWCGGGEGIILYSFDLKEKTEAVFEADLRE